MRKTFLAAAALAIGITGLAGVSHAAPFNPTGPQGPSAQLTIQLGGPIYHQRVLSNQQIRFVLQRRGYHDIRFLSRGPLRVTVRAEDFRGRDFRLVVSARTGAVISRVALNNRGPFQHGPFQHGQYGGWNG